MRLPSSHSVAHGATPNCHPGADRFHLVANQETYRQSESSSTRKAHDCAEMPDRVPLPFKKEGGSRTLQGYNHKQEATKKAGPKTSRSPGLLDIELLEACLGILGGGRCIDNGLNLGLNH